VIGGAAMTRGLLAEFDAGDKSTQLAAELWRRYLESGTLSRGQLKAVSAKDANEFQEYLSEK